ncbi:MAG: glycosyltransferase family 4 protein [Candidatus Colwellbacteria bacterium]|nr:glycosyltransferase family 4 protein [Candidatus Colwellbacteria bacterium]
MALKSKSEKPAIGIFHYSSPPNTSGVDVIIRDQARFFRQYGYKVFIVAGVGRQFRKDIPVHIIKRMNPRHPFVFPLFEELRKGIVSREFKQFERSLFNQIKNYIVKNDIKVCILHNLFTRPYNPALASALARLVQKMPEVKFISWVHDTVFYEEPNSVLGKELADVYPWKLFAKPIPGIIYICVSHYLKGNLLKAFGENSGARIEVIPNGHDVEKFWGLSPVIRALYKDIDGLGSELIGVVPVRAIPRKNLELALNITKAMNDHGTDFKLLLTAKMDYKRQINMDYYKKLKQLVKDLKIKDKVFFLSEYFDKFSDEKTGVPDIAISELYTISDLLLLTSKMEGFGLPLLEAGLMRCPIFAADIPPLREIGTTNINYFNLEMSSSEIADFILENIRRMPQAYFYRKIIKRYSLRGIFEKSVLPLVNESNAKTKE